MAMSDTSYEATQEMIFVIARLVAHLDLPEFLLRIEQCEAGGPVLDPTLYRKGAEKLGKIKAVATALNDFRLETMRQFPKLKVIENGGGEHDGR